MRGILALAFAAGCYSPHYEDCAISCTSNACPSGFECRSGVCRTEGASDPCTVNPMIDAALDSSSSEAPWGTPVQLALTSNAVFEPSLTADMLELYVMRDYNLFVSTRATPNNPWSDLTLVNISGNAGIKDQTPSISADGLTLMFSTTRSPSLGGQDIYLATRQQRGGPWTLSGPVAGVNSAVDDSGANTSRDGLTIAFASSRGTNMLDIYMAMRADLTSPWSAPNALPSLNAVSFNDSHPFLSADQLTIYFQSNRNGSMDLFRAHRVAISLPFDAPTPITELNGATTNEGDPWVSPDGHHLFFSSNRTTDGTSGIFESTR